MSLDTLTAALKRAESFRGLVYDDATGLPLKKGDVLKGNPTIGYGWNVSSDPMTEPEALDRLRKRALVAMSDAAALVSNWLDLDDVRRDVLANMAYNLGRAGLATFKKMLAAVEARDFVAAANEMLASRWAGQVGGRAQRLATEMRTGVAL